MAKIFQFIGKQNDKFHNSAKNYRGTIDTLFTNQIIDHITQIYHCGQFAFDIEERETLFNWLYDWRSFIYQQTQTFPEYTEILPANLTHKSAEIFLCYGHETDKEQVEGLYQVLLEAGHNPWLASQDTLPSDDIVLTINQAVQQADFGLICVSSEESTANEQAQIEQLLNLQTKINIEIIIIRLADCPIPETWQNFRVVDLFNETGLAELIKTIEVLQIRPPLSVNVVESPYGTMHPKSKFYIERTIDKLCWQNLQQPKGSTTVIQGASQTGKSSLMRRLLHQIEQTGDKKIVFIDFQEIPQTDFTDPDKFFYSFCLMLSDLLGLPDELDFYWGSKRSYIIKCGLYLTQHIMPKLHKPLIIALDEVDKMLVSPFRTDFFAMLRLWHNNRAYKAEFQRLSLFLSISTEPYLLIDNPNQSPFNVAPSIFVQDFTTAEIEKLNQLHGSPFSPDQLVEVVAWLNGHPFLTRLVLHEVDQGQVDFTTLLSQATQENGLFGDHLQRYYYMVAKHPELKEALHQIIQSESCSNDELFYRLQAIGLVERQGQQVVFRNQLYQRYFEEKFHARS